MPTSTLYICRPLRIFSLALRRTIENMFLNHTVGISSRNSYKFYIKRHTICMMPNLQLCKVQGCKLKQLVFFLLFKILHAGLYLLINLIKLHISWISGLSGYKFINYII